MTGPALDLASEWTRALTLARRASAHYSLSEREQELLFEIALGLPQGCLIVELGVCNGKTAIILAEVAWMKGGFYMGVDNWSLEGSHAGVYRLIDDAGLSEVAVLIEGSTHEVPLPVRPIDLLLIDAGHQESAVSVDCERWVPCIRPGGLLAMDDYPFDSHWRESCHWAVRHYADLQTADWDLVMAWNKLLVRRRPL